MDPDKMLEWLRALLGGDHSGGSHTREELQSVLCDAEEAFQDLDRWLSNGGAAPRAWAHRAPEGLVCQSCGWTGKDTGPTSECPGCGSRYVVRSP